MSDKIPSEDEFDFEGTTPTADEFNFEGDDRIEVEKPSKIASIGKGMLSGLTEGTAPLMQAISSEEGKPILQEQQYRKDLEDAKFERDRPKSIIDKIPFLGKPQAEAPISFGDNAPEPTDPKYKEFMDSWSPAKQKPISEMTMKEMMDISKYGQLTDERPLKAKEDGEVQALMDEVRDMYIQKNEVYRTANPKSYAASDMFAGTIRDLLVTKGLGKLAKFPKLVKLAEKSPKILNKLIKTFSRALRGGVTGKLRAKGTGENEDMGAVLGASTDVIGGALFDKGGDFLNYAKLRSKGKFKAPKFLSKISGKPVSSIERLRARNPQIKNAKQIPDISDYADNIITDFSKQTKRWKGEALEKLYDESPTIQATSVDDVLNKAIDKIEMLGGSSKEKKGLGVAYRHLDSLLERSKRLSADIRFSEQGDMTSQQLNRFIDDVSGVSKFDKDGFLKQDSDIIGIIRDTYDGLRKVGDDASEGYELMMANKLAPKMKKQQDAVDIFSKDKSVQRKKKVYSTIKKWVAGERDVDVKALKKLDAQHGGKIQVMIDDLRVQSEFFPEKADKSFWDAISGQMGVRTSVVGVAGTVPGLRGKEKSLGLIATGLGAARDALGNKIVKKTAKRQYEANQKKWTRKAFGKLHSIIIDTPNAISPKFSSMLRGSAEPFVKHMVMYKNYPEYRTQVDSISDGNNTGSDTVSTVD